MAKAGAIQCKTGDVYVSLDIVINGNTNMPADAS